MHAQGLIVSSLLLLADGGGKVTLSPSGQTWLVIALAGYLLMLLGVSIYASFNVKDEQDFLVAGRRLPLHLSWGALMATWFGSSAIIGATKNAWESGLSGVILDPFGCSATLLFTGLVFAKPLWRLQLFTMADFYKQKFGPKAEFIACAIQVPTFFCWIASQYVALAAVAEAYFPVDHTTAIIISAILVTTYTLIGGMWSVTLTDAIQIVIALVGLVALGNSVFASMGNGSIIQGVGTVLQQTDASRLVFVTDPTSYAWLLAIGTFLTGLFGNVPGQDLQQRIFASKDERTAMLSCVLSAMLYLAFGLIPVLLGLAAHVMQLQPAEGDTDGHSLLPLLAARFLGEGMVIVFVLAIISIVVSVATSATISQATILASNVLGRFKLFEGKHLLLDRVCVFIVTVGSVIVAFSGESIMGLLDIQLSLAMVCMFTPLVMGVFGKPRSELSGYLPMVVGGLVWLSRFLFERAVAPHPEGSDLAYPTHVAQAFAQAGYPSPVTTAAWLFAEIPADILGLLASIAAYFVAQAIARPAKSADEGLKNYPA